MNARAIIERQTPEGAQILLQTRDKPNERQQLELPGGQVEEFESLVDGLRREVREETGLDVVAIQGLSTRVEVEGDRTRVECLSPFAVYQTLDGPVDSMGVYLRCEAVGELLPNGDGSKDAFWASPRDLQLWVESEPERFSWVDRAGILFYLRNAGHGTARHADSGD